jgi:SAM-dependent methyltransferase
LRHARHGPPALPSPFVERHARRLAAAGVGRALDLASGSGRHARVLHALGFTTFALDFSRTALARLHGELPAVRALQADALALPIRPERFVLIVQTRFLERVILPELARALVRGGTLLVETFLVDEFERSGHPRREYCLERGELAGLCSAPGVGLTIDEVRETSTPGGADEPFLASIAARKS